MQYLHDNLKMYTIYGGKMQYPHYDPNPYYILARQFMDAHYIFL
jgi:hypothetical protein